MYDYTKIDYDNFYSGEQCERENNEIRRLLLQYVKDNDVVVDLGCGTGLVRNLIGDSRKITYLACDAKFRNSWSVLERAETFIERVSPDVVTCTFSLNYMSVFMLSKILRRKPRCVIAVVYDRPYLKGSASIYAGRRLWFWTRLWVKRSFILAYARLKGAKMWGLCGQPYYRVIVFD